MRIVLSSAHVILRRVGKRMMPPAPKARHASPAAASAAGSQPLATCRPAAFNGTDAKSPFGGVIIRHRQSSVICATQLPVTSTCAAARGKRGGGGPGGPGGCAETSSANREHARETAARHDHDETINTPLPEPPPEANASARERGA